MLKWGLLALAGSSLFHQRPAHTGLPFRQTTQEFAANRPGLIPGGLLIWIDLAWLFLLTAFLYPPTAQFTGKLNPVLN